MCGHGSVSLDEPGVQRIRLIRHPNFDPRLRFGRVPFSQITLLDAQTWLSWSCCGLSYEQVRADPEKSRLIDTGVQLLQARTGWKFPQGIGKTGGVGTSSKEKDANVRLMRLTMDPVRVWPRPLWWYAALWAGDVLAMRYIYRRFGLRQVSVGVRFDGFPGKGIDGIVESVVQARSNRVSCKTAGIRY